MSRDSHLRPEAYLQTVERMEPDITYVDRDGALASIAISLKRIADVMEKKDSEREFRDERFTTQLSNAIWSGLTQGRQK